MPNLLTLGFHLRFHFFVFALFLASISCKFLADMVLCFAPSSLASFDFGAFNAHAAAVTEKKREKLVGGEEQRGSDFLLLGEKNCIWPGFFLTFKLCICHVSFISFKIGKNGRLTYWRGGLKKYRRCHLNIFLILLPNELFNTKYEKLIIFLKI